jgi:hypothetical protein
MHFQIKKALFFNEKSVCEKPFPEIKNKEIVTRKIFFMKDIFQKLKVNFWENSDFYRIYRFN